MSVSAMRSGEISEVFIIGAGPAGVLAGLDLISAGVPRDGISIVDPTFTAGDLYRKFPRVPGNTAAGSYLSALARHLNGVARPAFSIEDIPPTETCPISYLTPPIQWLSEKLLAQVRSETGFITDLSLQEDGLWRLTSNGDDPWSLLSRSVILTTGGRPKELDGLCTSDSTRAKLIPLRKALDSEAFRAEVNNQDSVAILGSSHSGILALMHLMQMPANQQPRLITIFHRSPIRLSSNVDGVTFYDNSGLKGVPKLWAQKNLVNEPDGTIRFVGHVSPGTEVNFVRITEKDDLGLLIEADGTYSKIVDARGLLPRVKPQISSHLLSTCVSASDVARFGAVDSQLLPGLFAAGSFAPKPITERTLHAEEIHAFDVGVTKFAKSSGDVASATYAYLIAA